MGQRIVLFLICLSFSAMGASKRLNDVLNYYGCSSKDKSTKCKMIKRHIRRDTKKCIPHPHELSRIYDTLVDNNITKSHALKVRGANLYLGFVPGKYSYEVYLNEAKEMVIDSRIHFLNKNKFSEAEMAALQKKMNTAAWLWGNWSDLGFPVAFKFTLAKKFKNGSIRTAFLQRKSTRGPYFHRWSTGWKYNTIAHEFGHMMGLDDEYKNSPWPSNSKCDRHSIMCSSGRGTPQDYLYYLIIRRAYCSL
jgi:hypothetical protein